MLDAQLNRWNELGFKRMHFESKNKDEIDKFRRALAEAGNNRRDLYMDDVGEIDETLYQLACEKKKERIEREKKMKELVYYYYYYFRVLNTLMNGKE